MDVDEVRWYFWLETDPEGFINLWGSIAGPCRPTLSWSTWSNEPMRVCTYGALLLEPALWAHGHAVLLYEP